MYVVSIFPIAPCLLFADFFESILKDFRSEYAIYLKHCIHEDSQDVCYDVKEREHCIIIPKRGSNERLV